MLLYQANQHRHKYIIIKSPFLFCVLSSSDVQIILWSLIFCLGSFGINLQEFRKYHWRFLGFLEDEISIMAISLVRKDIYQKAYDRT